MATISPPVDRASASIPLTLYVHVPWCVRKCPYCDFNSHVADTQLPEQAYLAALLRDLDFDIPLTGGRSIEAIFFGGGTPSLCSTGFYADLLAGIRERIAVNKDAEITLEANPGTVSEAYLADLRAAGVNRLSIGVQSLDDELLLRIGRIHGSRDALNAIRAAQRAGFDEINLDLMFGLPGQSQEQVLSDVRTAMALEPTHLSYYQLTLEAGTPFARQPPRDLPADDHLWEMQEAGTAALEAGGYRRYEVSAYTRNGRECRHNRNYWEFGDYLGLGAGAHGKLTRRPGSYLRTRKMANPAAYQRSAGTSSSGTRIEEGVQAAAMVEFLLNALRLIDGFPLALFEQRTGYPRAAILAVIQRAVEAGSLQVDGHRIRTTSQGLRYLDEVLAQCAFQAGD